jgi:integrase/recombinase XerD
MLAPDPPGPDSVALFSDYLRRERGAAESTVENYLRDLEKFQAWLTSRGQALEQVHRRDIQEYLAARMAEGLSPQSARRTLSALRAFYCLLLDDERVRTNPTTCVPLPKAWKALPKFLEFKELEQMVRWVDRQKDPLAVRDKAILLTLFASGLRESELVSLRLADLDLEAGFVKVWNGKGGKDGIAPLSPPAADALGTYLQTLRPKLVGEQKCDCVFLTGRHFGHGSKLTRQALFYRIRDISRASIGRDVHPHEFRHGCATALVRGGADIRDVQAVLRHSDINTTQIYTHVDITYLRGCYAKSHPRG